MTERAQQAKEVTLYALNDAGEKTTATPGAVGRCTCGATMRAKCGKVYVWHWSHEDTDCDPWSEPETEWHRWWKARARPECCEVYLPPHRADIRRDDGYIIELQHSPISVDEIGERERFYGCIAWIFNAAPFRDRLLLRHEGDEVKYVWRHPRPSLFAVRKPLFLDLGPRVFEVTRPMERIGTGRMHAKQEFLARARLRELDGTEIVGQGVTILGLLVRAEGMWHISRDFDSLDAARATDWFRDRPASRGWAHVLQYADGRKEPVTEKP